jgi:type I restriction enzyme S subunit
LGDTGLYINGLAFKPEDWGKQGRPIIRIQNLSGVSATLNYTERSVDTDNVVSRGDLLVSWSATLDTFIWDGPEGVLNQHIFKVIPNRCAVAAGFLYWLLKHEVKVLADSQHAHGLAMMHINRGPFLGHTVSLPPLEEQARIVAKIDDMMTLCDKLEVAQAEREQKRGRLRLLSFTRLTASVSNGVDRGKVQEAARFYLNHSDRMLTRAGHVAQLRQTIIDLAVLGRLVPQERSDQPAARLVDAILKRRRTRESDGAISYRESKRILYQVPISWEWVSLSTACRFVTDGDHQPPPKADSGIPFLVIGNVRSGRVDLRDCRHVPEEYYAQLDDAHRPRAGDVLYTLVGSYGVPVPVMREEAFCVQRHIGILRPEPEVLQRYAVIALKSTFSLTQASECATGIAQKTVPLSGLRRLAIPLPPLAEQRRICVKVGDLLGVCDQLEASLSAAEMGRAKLAEAVLRAALGDDWPVDRS